MSGRRILLIFGLTFAAVGLALALFAAWLRDRAATARTWPTASGTVTASQVQSGTDADGSFLYWPEVRYAYSVGDREYLGGRVRATLTRTSSPDHATAVVSRYPTGSTVTVRYDPANPASALLDPDPGLIVPILFGAGGLCVVIGAATLLAARRAAEGA